MKTVKIYSYEDVASKLWDVLEKNDSISKLKLDAFRFSSNIKPKVLRSFDNKTPDIGVDINKYLDRACNDIVEWNGSYDEALQITNGMAGYNWENGKWDLPITL